MVPNLRMTPEPGVGVVRHVGDRLVMTLDGVPQGARAVVRCQLGRGPQVLTGILGEGPVSAGWHDLDMIAGSDGQWRLDIPLTETGVFHAICQAVSPNGSRHWVTGNDLTVMVHPDWIRCGNTIYCAFVRMFGNSKSATTTRSAVLDDVAAVLDQHGWTAIPPSGTLRDLKRQIPHIVDTLGCRIVHLLPVTPTPTTHARFGRYGSPYAAQDLVAVDPALAEFDHRTTPVEQFIELTQAVRSAGARTILDIVLNHTGWAATLFSQHPEWYRRQADGRFHSPGAWGNTWEDLVELDHSAVGLTDVLADSLVEWCRRGVDGFRCDAGYMLPLTVWQRIIAKVRRAYPDTVFLLEGLGGAWELTQALLGHGGMQWAYSELFQNHEISAMRGYLAHCQRAYDQSGILIHYSETHDNARLAAKGRDWSLLRNRICALTSNHGGFGFSAGVEWLASEKLEVHHCRGLRWGNPDNIVKELAALNRLLSNHPAFFDGVSQHVLANDGPLLLVERTYDKGRVLVVINTDLEQGFPRPEIPSLDFDLLTNAAAPDWLAPGQALVLAGGPTLASQWSGDAYRQARARAALAYACLAHHHPIQVLGPVSWTKLAAMLDADPVGFVHAMAHLDHKASIKDLGSALQIDNGPAPVVEWNQDQVRRIVPVPSGWWVLVEHPSPFVCVVAGRPPQRAVLTRAGWITLIAPLAPGQHKIALSIDGEPTILLTGTLRGLPSSLPSRDGHGHKALLTNGRGGMARLARDLVGIHSKYDAVLAANLHPSAPCDRHVFVKRLRIWADVDGFVSALNVDSVVDFRAGATAAWTFSVPAGAGLMVQIQICAGMDPHRNALCFTMQLADDERHMVALTLRLDLEDRSFHGQTQRSDAERLTQVMPLTHLAGFRFSPGLDRGVTSWLTGPKARYQSEPEWCEGIAHPIEAGRGMAASGDAYSPGWFRVELTPGQQAMLAIDADLSAHDAPTPLTIPVPPPHLDPVADLRQAISSFVVNRGTGKTIIAGYPWFLDWGRDTLICVRGLIEAGEIDTSLGILSTFARFAEGGTLPNLLNGDRAENRDTSDAPLWFCQSARELAQLAGKHIWDSPMDHPARTLGGVVESLIDGYIAGTTNGIRVDLDSGLVWSPPHFTWMDTNYPAATPRQGYPIEIQALWWSALNQSGQRGRSDHAALALRVKQGMARFWLPDHGWFADVLLAEPMVHAAQAVPDSALRPNQAFAIALGAITGAKAQSAVRAMHQHLVIPGAMRTLAPLTVTPPLTVLGQAGQLLVNPDLPYQGRYEGDEDTRRKPAYHNGTGWPWLLPTWAEAFVKAFDGHPRAVAAARGHLAGLLTLNRVGPGGHIPEIIDGDAPHTPRGCDAQAWSVTEPLRVWLALQRGFPQTEANPTDSSRAPVAR